MSGRSGGAERPAGIYRIDPATNEATLAFEKPGWSYGVAYGDGALWVSGTEDGTLTRFDLPG